MTVPTPPANPRGEAVPPGETGYAVGKDQLRVETDEERFELDLSAEESAALRNAVRWDDGTTDAIVETVPTRNASQIGMKGSTFRGDLPALESATEALRAYENEEAGIGEDKIAYDTRTALNHAERAVKDRLEDG